MRIAIFITAPADAHFYRYIVSELEKHGHIVGIFLRNYGDTVEIANISPGKARIFSNPPESGIGKMIATPIEIQRAIRETHKFRPDLIIGGGMYGAFAASINNCPFIEFLDGETRLTSFYSLQTKIYRSLVDTVVTPDCYLEDLGMKHIKVNSFKELAYLHPRYFQPREDILQMIGVRKEEDFVLLRFNAFNAVEDIGLSSMTIKDKIQLVKRLESYARVFISCEGKIPDELASYRLNVPKNRIHDVLFFAKIVLGETGTITTEAACLGTPAIIVHPNARRYGNFRELQDRYGLIYGFEKNFHEALEKAIYLIKNKDTRRLWGEKKRRMLEDKIDMTRFMVWLIEKYPDSFWKIKQNPTFDSLALVSESYG